MTAIGFDIGKGAIWSCALDGTRSAPKFQDLGRQRFNPDHPRPELANYFKQVFCEIIDRVPSPRLAYRPTLNVKSADQVTYLCFPFGILNLVAHERGPAIDQFITASSKQALGFTGDRFAACDAIKGRPEHWDRDAKLAALSAWMVLNG